MEISLRLTLILCLFSFSMQSQNLLPQSCYMRLEGSTDQGGKITMHLIKVNDSLYGDFNSTQIFGKINPKGSFWLKQWPGDTGVEFKGQFKGDHHFLFTREKTARQDKIVPFELIEKYPEGSIQFKVYYETALKKIAKEAKSAQALLKLALLVPDVTANHASQSDSLHLIILKNFNESTDYKTDAVSDETILVSMKKEFFDNYVSSNETIYKEMPDANLGWELQKFTHIIYNEDLKVTFYILAYTFTGGAHGLETLIYHSVDLKTGKVITLNDLFKPGYENRLILLLTDKLHQMLRLPVQGKLTESGYFVDEVKPNDNFYLNGQGIGFFYNHYEIAPYSSGATDIFLTREELKGILK